MAALLGLKNKFSPSVPLGLHVARSGPTVLLYQCSFPVSLFLEISAWKDFLTLAVVCLDFLSGLYEHYRVWLGPELVKFWSWN